MPNGSCATLSLWQSVRPKQQLFQQHRCTISNRNSSGNHQCNGNPVYISCPVIKVQQPHPLAPTPVYSTCSTSPMTNSNGRRMLWSRPVCGMRQALFAVPAISAVFDAAAAQPCLDGAVAPRALRAQGFSQERACSWWGHPPRGPSQAAP